MSADPVARIATLIRRYHPDQAATFRNGFREALDSLRLPAGDPLQERLLALRSLAETWAAGRATADEALTALIGVASEPSPQPVLNALIRHFPRKPPADWNAFLATNPDRAMLQALLGARLITAKELRSFARANPEAAARSAVLDVMLERRIKVPREVWSEGVPARPAELMPGPLAAARAFAADSSPASIRWFIGFLASLDSDRSRVLDALLEFQSASMALLRVILFDRAGKRDREHRAAVLNAWLAVAESRMPEGTPHGETAALLIGFARLQRRAEEGPDVELPAQVGTLALLRRAIATQGDQPGRTDVPLVVGTARLAGEMIEIFGGLAVAGPDMQRDPRVLLAVHAAQKHLLLGLLEALDADAGSLRASVNAALINAGVTPLCDNGETGNFDARRHEAREAVLPGAPVVVQRHGWQLGEGQDAIVLVRARVNPARYGGGNG